MFNPALDGSSYSPKHSQVGNGKVWGKYPGGLRVLSPGVRRSDTQLLNRAHKELCICEREVGTVPQQVSSHRRRQSTPPPISPFYKGTAEGRLRTDEETHPFSTQHPAISRQPCSQLSLITVSSAAYKPTLRLRDNCAELIEGLISAPPGLVTLSVSAAPWLQL